MSDRCPHVTGDTTMYCEQAERFARERDEARDEVERLRDSLSVTGDTRHEAMEAAIRVAEAHSETIRQLRDEVERLRAAIAEADHTDGCAYTRAFRKWQFWAQTRHTAPIEAELCDCFVSVLWREEVKQ